MDQKQQSRESGSETGCAASEQQSTGAAEARCSCSHSESCGAVYEEMVRLVDFAEVLAAEVMAMARDSTLSDRAPCLDLSLRA